MSGAEVSVWRYLIGSVCLLLVSVSLKGSRDLITPLRQHGMQITILSVFGMALGQLLFHWSLDFASVTQVATMVTTMPMGVVVMDFVINRTKISAPKIVSGVGAFAGVVLLLTDGYVQQLSIGGSALYGVVMALGCSVIGSCYLVLVRPLIQSYGAIRITTLTFVLGAVALWVTVGVAWEIWVDPTTLFERPSEAYWSLLVLGIWNTCIGFILWFWGLICGTGYGSSQLPVFFETRHRCVVSASDLGESD